MLSRNLVEDHFDRGIQRSRSILALYDYIDNRSPEAHDISDLLRSCIVIASSAFDLLHHQLIRSLTYLAISNSVGEHYITIPISIFIDDPIVQQQRIDHALRTENSYRSFLMPDKIGLLYSKIIPSFWEKIADHLGQTSSKSVTSRVKNLGDWRNRIVHESDINPDLGGIEEWPILATDVYEAINDYEEIGNATIAVGFAQMTQSLQATDAR
jgi:hypothetical protein